MNEVLLDIENLRTYFHVREGVAKAVDGVSFQLRKGETLGLVGESGCGKTVTSLSILKLLDIPPAEYRDGRIVFEGRNLLEAGEKEMRKVRGKRISMIFQEPMTSLNPLMSIGSQIQEMLVKHEHVGWGEARRMSIEFLSQVGIPAPRRRIDEHPHQLSGGMRQRVMIALALVCNPTILIADEPTTALDVTIQAQILDLMRRLQTDLGTSILLITHDLGVIAETADHVAVMYAAGSSKSPTSRPFLRIPFIPIPGGCCGPSPGLMKQRGPSV